VVADYVIGAALTEATWRRPADPAAPTDDELCTAGLDAILSGAQSSGQMKPPVL
jgi:hypothetical protein